MKSTIAKNRFVSAYMGLPHALRAGYALSSLWGVLVLGYACFSGEMLKMAPNEWGDFFGGAAAPLAFLWLVVAVFLQKDELALQRQELKESREAQQLQAKETGALVVQNTEAVKIAQASFAEDQRRAQEARIDQLVDMLAKRIVLNSSKLVVRIGDVNHRLLGSEGKTDDADAVFSRGLQALEWIVPKLHTAKLIRDAKLLREDVDAIERIVGTILESAAKASFPVLQARIDMLELKRFHALLTELNTWLSS